MQSTGNAAANVRIADAMHLLLRGTGHLLEGTKTTFMNQSSTQLPTSRCRLWLERKQEKHLLISGRDLARCNTRIHHRF